MDGWAGTEGFAFNAFIWMHCKWWHIFQPVVPQPDLKLSSALATNLFVEAEERIGGR